MIQTTVTYTTEEEKNQIEKKLKETGYKKTNDCMWAKIYTKGNNEIIVSKA